MPAKNPFLLYSRPTNVTGRALCERLGIAGGRTLSKIGDHDLLIRWGASQLPHLDEDFRSRLGTVNHADCIGLISNRHHMYRRLLYNLNIANCLSVCDEPIAVNTGDAALTTERVTLLRHRFGRWGRDIVRVKNLDRGAWRDIAKYRSTKYNGYFSVEEWLADHEVRLHIFKGRCILAQIKDLRPGETFLPLRKAVIRNDHHNWGLYPLSDFRAESLGIFKHEIRNAAKEVISGVSLDVGVADFLVRTNPFQWKMLEINTAPGLEGQSLEKYVENFRDLILNSDRPAYILDDMEEDMQEDSESDYSEEEVVCPPGSTPRITGPPLSTPTPYPDFQLRAGRIVQMSPTRTGRTEQAPHVGADRFRGAHGSGDQALTPVTESVFRHITTARGRSPMLEWSDSQASFHGGGE